MFDKLDDLLRRYEEIMNELHEPTVADNQTRFRALMKEQSNLTPIVEAYTECEEFTSITPEIREEFHDYLEDAFIECKELVDKTAVLHYIFFQ